jgi:hypothetical protein
MYMVLPEHLTFSLSVKFDDKPLRTPHLRRFSLIFKAEGSKEEAIIRGCLLPQGHKQVFAPSTFVKGKQYDICQFSPALQEAILNSFSFEDLFPVQRKHVSTARERHSTSEIREYLK